MDIEHLKNIFNAYRHQDRSKLHITPYRDWGIVLAITALLFIAVAVYGYSAYDTYFVKGVGSEVSEDTPVSSSKSDVDVLKKDIDETLLYFKNKEEKHKKLLLEKRHFNTIFIATTTKDISVKTSASSSIATTTPR